VVGDVVGAADGEGVGAGVGNPVGSELVGDVLGELVGSEDVGDVVGELVGSELVGNVVGFAVGLNVSQLSPPCFQAKKAMARLDDVSTHLLLFSARVPPFSRKPKGMEFVELPRFMALKYFS